MMYILMGRCGVGHDKEDEEVGSQMLSNKLTNALISTFHKSMLWCSEQKCLVTMFCCTSSECRTV